jgi:hypothetical protein
MKIIATIPLALAALSPALCADCTRLNFSSLPSAQGWLYLPYPTPPNAPIETNVFSVDGAKLVLNTLGENYAVYYKLRGVVPSNAPFTLTLRARVLEALGEVHAFRVKVDHDVLGRYYFHLGTNSLGTTIGGGVYPIDATQFHTYRMEGVTGGPGRLYVDDVLLAEGGPAEGEDNEVAFGAEDGSNRVEITQLDFCARRGPTVSASVACIDVCWDSLNNRLCQVQYRCSLTTNQWANLGSPVAGNGGTNCITDTVRGEPRRFYRVVETPQG